MKSIPILAIDGGGTYGRGALWDETGHLMAYAADCSIDGIASLAPVIFQLADEGDVIAMEVLSKAASELAYACRTAIEKLGLSNQTFLLILGGGILQHNRFVADFLIGKSATRYSFESYILDKQPLFCALLYGLKKINGVTSETKPICSRLLLGLAVKMENLVGV
jgi:N-acetylglucosamine kinase-like BadF-type ATPase